MEEIWQWLNDKTNQETLMLFGGGFVTFVGGAWAVYKFRHDKKNKTASTVPSPTSATTLSHNSGGIQASGDVNIGAGAQVDASSRTIITNLQGVDPKEHAALAIQLDVTESALSNFFKILGEAEIAPEDLDHKLREIAAKHRELLARLDAPDVGDDAIPELKAQTRKAIESGDYNLAEKLLNQASDKDAAIGKERLRAAATNKAVIAELKAIEFKYADAASYWQQAHNLLPGGEQILRAKYLNQVGHAWYEAGRYADALPAFEQALALREQALGPDHPDVAMSLNNLAGLLDTQGAYAKAEPLFLRSLKISENAFGPEHPHVATGLNNLAGLYHSQGADAQAAPLYQRSLTIRENALGPDHPDVAASLNNLAELYGAQGAYVQAEPCPIWFESERGA